MPSIDVPCADAHHGRDAQCRQHHSLMERLTPSHCLGHILDVLQQLICWPDKIPVQQTASAEPQSPESASEVLDISPWLCFAHEEKHLCILSLHNLETAGMISDMCMPWCRVTPLEQGHMQVLLLRAQRLPATLLLPSGSPVEGAQSATGTAVVYECLRGALQWIRMPVMAEHCTLQRCSVWSCFRRCCQAWPNAEGRRAQINPESSHQPQMVMKGQLG